MHVRIRHRRPPHSLVRQPGSLSLSLSPTHSLTLSLSLSLVCALTSADVGNSVTAIWLASSGLLRSCVCCMAIVGAFVKFLVPRAWCIRSPTPSSLMGAHTHTHTHTHTNRVLGASVPPPQHHIKYTDVGTDWASMRINHEQSSARRSRRPRAVTSQERKRPGRGVQRTLSQAEGSQSVGHVFCLVSGCGLSAGPGPGPGPGHALGSSTGFCSCAGSASGGSCCTFPFPL